MKKTKFIVKTTSAFRKDYKQVIKRGLDVALLDDVVTKLAMGLTLGSECHDHGLSGRWKGHRECHIRPD